MYVYWNIVNTFILLLPVGFHFMICHQVCKTCGAVINMDKHIAFFPSVLER